MSAACPLFLHGSKVMYGIVRVCVLQRCTCVLACSMVTNEEILSASNDKFQQYELYSVRLPVGSALSCRHSHHTSSVLTGLATNLLEH